MKATYSYIVLNHNGDSVQTYKDGDTALAEAFFQKQVKIGATPIQLDPETHKPDTLLTKFDPQAREVLFVPRMVGG